MLKRKNGKIVRLISTIEKELGDLDKLKLEIDQLDVHTTNPRVLGSILHDFYTGVEKIFMTIANELEGGVPESRSWHKDLLDDMALELEGIRPPVIDDDLRQNLEEYLRFRHLFRGIYGFDLDMRRLEVLFAEFSDVYDELISAIRTFIGFLRTLL